MAGITHVNLDDISPENLDREIEDERIANERGWGRNGYCRRHLRQRHKNRDSQVGVDPKKLYDWRHLEIRAHQLSELHKKFHTQEWALVAEIAKTARKKKFKEAWISCDKNPEYVTVVNLQRHHHVSTSLRSLKDIIANGIANPEYKGMLVKGESQVLYSQFHERTETSRRRMWVYNAAFQRAVEERLKVFVKTTLYRKDIADFYYHTPGIFLVENASRQYVITSDNCGQLKWGEGRIFTVA